MPVVPPLGIRLLHSYPVLRDLRRETPFFRRNEDVIVSSVNLGVFIFLVTALVFVLQFGENPAIEDYVDALYFTVATLTTTGFGDITLTGTAGQLLAVFIMVAGVVPDAVHCKHCGLTLKIETEGAG